MQREFTPPVRGSWLGRAARCPAAPVVVPVVAVFAIIRAAVPARRVIQPAGVKAEFLQVAGHVFAREALHIHHLQEKQHMQRRCRVSTGAARALHAAPRWHMRGHAPA